MNRQQQVILVFARAPIPGKAKTRLIPALGEEGAALLQQQLLVRTVAEVCQIDGCDIELWCAPDSRHPLFQQLEREYPCRLLPQLGNDLGERMAYAMQQALDVYQSAIIIGTDCPALSVDDILHSFKALNEGSDAVIGPAADGGYYLLGLRRFEPTLFQAIRWGSDTVLAMTRERLTQGGMHYRQLATKHDLDRPEDLKYFPELYSSERVVAEGENDGT